MAKLAQSSRTWLGGQKRSGDFDQFAGATITPRAVVSAVHKALQYFDQHHAELFAQLNTAQVKP